MTTYSEKILDPRWKKKRLEILRRDSYYCVMCGDNKSELQVHHKKYTVEPWEADNKDLATYCKYCHEIETLASRNGCHLDRSMISLGIRMYKLSNDMFFIGKVEQGRLIIYINTMQPQVLSEAIYNFVNY